MRCQANTPIKSDAIPSHIEQHFTAGDTVRDIVIGMSDGLTVPFALAAGITGAISQTHLIVAAGFAEISAGSIAMGLGATSLPGAMPNTMPMSRRGKNRKSSGYRRRRRRRCAIFSKLWSLGRGMRDGRRIFAETAEGLGSLHDAV